MILQLVQLQKMYSQYIRKKINIHQNVVTIPTTLTSSWYSSCVYFFVILAAVPRLALYASSWCRYLALSFVSLFRFSLQHTQMCASKTKCRRRRRRKCRRSAGCAYGRPLRVRLGSCVVRCGMNDAASLPCSPCSSLPPSPPDFDHQ